MKNKRLVLKTAFLINLFLLFFIACEKEPIRANIEIREYNNVVEWIESLEDIHDGNVYFRSNTVKWLFHNYQCDSIDAYNQINGAYREIRCLD